MLKIVPCKISFTPSSIFPEKSSLQVVPNTVLKKKSSIYRESSCKHISPNSLFFILQRLISSMLYRLRPIRREHIPVSSVSCSMERQGIFLPPPPLGGILDHRRVLPALHSPVPVYTRGWRGTESERLAQKHNTVFIARPQAQTV